MANGNGATAWSVLIDGVEAGALKGKLVPGADPGHEPPELDLRVEGAVIKPIKTRPGDEGGLVFSVDIPSAVLTSGMVVLMVCDRSSGLPLASLPMLIDQALEGDLTAEIERLRAELTTLKMAFLRDASEPKLRAVERDLIVAEAVEAMRKKAHQSDDNL